MHRRIWFLAAAALAVMVLAGSASALTTQKSLSTTVNVAQEQDLSAGCGWNINLAGCNLAWAVWVGYNPILRGPYLVGFTNGHYTYKSDLATNVQVTPTYIKYTIRPSAKWNYGGHVSPVTWQDFAYTVEMLNNPNNLVAGNTGVNQISSVTHKGNTVTFFWKKPGQKALGGNASTIGCNGNNACGPFADYKDLLGSIMPYAATHTQKFNSQLFNKCICGANGHYITDGPYYMASYHRGQGSTLKVNSKTWYGVKPKVKTVNFKVESSTTTEIQAIKGGEVDVASPQPTPDIAPLAKLSSIKYTVAPGNFIEHIDLEQGNTGPNTPAEPLLKDDWFRQSIMLGLNRTGIIHAALPGVANGLKPLDSLLFTDGGQNPFHQWNYNTAAAITKLNAHCNGGPSVASSSNTKVWTCGGHQAEFTFEYAVNNSRRLNSFLIIQQELKAIGIKVDGDPENSATGSFFTDDGNGAFNAIEFAWGGSPDPGGATSVWSCGGGENFIGYCNSTVTNKLNDALSNLNATSRKADFFAADKAMANDVAAIPLYALPEIVTAKKKIGGVKPNPAAGFTWNMEDWYWHS